MNRINILCLATGILTGAGTASAQVTGPEQHTEKAPAETASEDVTSWSASIGGSHNAGNTEAWQLNAASEFKLVRGPHGMQSGVTFAYGQANLPDDMQDDFETTVKNFNAKLRYDYFFTKLDAVFGAARFRWDEFAGLDARAQGQVGYLRVLFTRPKHRLWGEVGYDLTYDNYHPDPLPNPDFDAMMAGTGPEFLPGDEVIHSARVFLGYENQVNEVLTYVGGAEGLFNVEDSADWRLNVDNALRSKIAGNLQLEIKVTLQYDHVPVPGARSYDLQSQINLIYSLI